MIERDKNYHDDEDHDHDADHDQDHDESLDYIDYDEDAYLERRGQNIEILKLSVKMAGFGQNTSPLKPGELRQAMDQIEKIYSFFEELVEPPPMEEDDEVADIDEDDDDEQ